MYGAPEVWHALCEPAGRDHADLPAGPGRRRRVGGAAVRLVGRRAVRGRLPALRAAALDGRARRACRAGVPRIHFGVGTGELLGAMAEAGADVVGVDWRTPLDGRRGPGRRAGRCRATSTRACCSRRGTVVEAEVRRVLRGGPARRPATCSTSATACCRRPTPTVLTRVVALVHEHLSGPGRRRRSDCQEPSAYQPPSTESVVPLTKPLRAGSARNATACATSSGSANRPSGTWSVMSASP